MVYLTFVNSVHFFNKHLNDVSNSFSIHFIMFINSSSLLFIKANITNFLKEKKIGYDWLPSLRITNDDPPDG
ncbi:hypothetical protein DERP_000767 [Dermatophagoides pteronyssinus]|uniref:Uncharacterized protein n=1 Tax=Dermatophagoides pteronyssinus TaxID=6956 RepID=A0ABQ8J154_DERPT|nr:hypothetical protein DERP_000767 [Dermatophagoides pteronyssinus]